MEDFPQLLARFAVANSCLGADVEAYSSAVSENFPNPTEAFAHYQRAGRAARPELFPFIDPDFYQAQLARLLPSLDVPEAVTPFEHYVTVGAKHGVSPIPLFDSDYVRSQADHLPFEDIFDFLANSALDSADPHPLFSKRYYASLHVDVANAGMDPFAHFVRVGWKERRSFHPFFQASEYTRFEFPIDCDRLAFNERLAFAYESPKLSLMQPLFDVRRYLQSFESSDAIVTPLQHFLTAGWRQNASAFPLFDQAFFIAQAPKIRPSVNPYVEYLSDFSHAYAPNDLFDPVFYVQSAGVTSAYWGSLLEHFVRIGAAAGARPHRSVAVTSAYPSRFSGFDAIRSFDDISGRRRWLCAPSLGGLASSLDQINSIEPALSGDFLQSCELPAFSCPLDKYEMSLTTATIKCARCNCLVVSHSVLDDTWISRLSSSFASLVSTGRPWLTLISCAAPAVRYWHVVHGCKALADFLLPDADGYKTRLIGQIIVASIPNRVVIRTDPFGIGLLRAHGSQILSVIPDVSLLVDIDGLTPDDHRWLGEYLAGVYSELRSLIFSDLCALELIKHAGIDERRDMPRLIGV